MYKLRKQLLVTLTASALALPGISQASLNSTDNATQSNSNHATLAQKADFSDTHIHPSIALRSKNPVKNLYADLLYTNHSTHFLASDTHSITDGFYGNFEVPISDKQDLNFTVSKDIVTSATPVFYQPDGDSARQITTSASVKDTRNAINIQTTRYEDKFSLAVNGGFSTEEDYDSHFFGLNASFDFNQRNTTLILGTGFSKNDSHPITTDFDREGGKSIDNDYLLGVTQVLTQKSLIQQNLYYHDQRGYLSDPYKLTYIFFPRPDSRPETRHIFTYLAHYAYYFGNPALHLKYRYYKDSWGVFSHTMEGIFKIPVARGWMITPELRYYTQKAPRFYGLYFNDVPANGHFSSDYRLANFGQLSARLQIEKEFAKSYKLYASYEHARRKKGLQLTHSRQTQAGEKKFTRLSLSSFIIGFQKLFG